MKKFLLILSATVLLAAGIAAAGRQDYLWSESYPLMFVGMLWPWLMLACLRYLPISRWFRAGAACFVTALYRFLIRSSYHAAF